MNKKKVIVSGILFLIAVFLLVYSNLILPAKVVVQLDFKGSASTIIPKFLAILLPFVISVIGLLGYLLSKENQQKYLVVTIVGLGINLLNFVFNGVFKL